MSKSKNRGGVPRHCFYCGRDFTIRDHLFGRVMREDRWEAHTVCFAVKQALRGEEEARQVFCKLVKLEREVVMLRRSLVQTGVMLMNQGHRNTHRLEAVLIEATREEPLTLLETRKILYWLEMNAARREDSSFGVIAPEVVTLLEKVSGMTADELSHEIKDRDLKRALNRATTERSKNGKVRHKG